MKTKNKSILKCYAFGWITLGLFVFSLIGHWVFAWSAYVSEQNAHQQPVEISGYVVETARDTFENWQSEFLQLLWQVAGLALFLYVGSSQSKESDERQEAKLDAILKKLDPEKSACLIAKIDRDFYRD